MKENKYFIVVGAILEKDGKILLVQEGKPPVYGLWNIPSGRLKRGEDALEGARREVKEETGFDVKIDGLLGVYLVTFSDISKTDNVKIVFRCSIVGGKLQYSKKDFLEVKWFEPSDVLAMKDSELRGIKSPIQDFINGKNYPLDIIKPIKIIQK